MHRRGRVPFEQPSVKSPPGARSRRPRCRCGSGCTGRDPVCGANPHGRSQRSDRPRRRGQRDGTHRSVRHRRPNARLEVAHRTSQPDRCRVNRDRTVPNDLHATRRTHHRDRQGPPRRTLHRRVRGLAADRPIPEERPITTTPGCHRTPGAPSRTSSSGPDSPSTTKVNSISKASMTRGVATRSSRTPRLCDARERARRFVVARLWHAAGPRQRRRTDEGKSRRA